jgi:hypothetical protein
MLCALLEVDEFSSPESVSSITGPKDLTASFPFPFLPFVFSFAVATEPDFGALNDSALSCARDCERVRTRMGDGDDEEQRSIISFVRIGGIQCHGVENVIWNEVDSRQGIMGPQERHRSAEAAGYIHTASQDTS